MRGGREEFDADALTFVGKVANENDAAFLLFFGDRIDQQDVGAHFEFGLHVEQGAVSVDDDGLAILAELAAGGGFARGAHWNAREDACAATSGRAGRYSLHKLIVRLVAVRVNCAFSGGAQNVSLRRARRHTTGISGRPLEFEPRIDFDAI